MAGRKSAGRVTIATVIATKTAPQEGAAAPPPQARPGEAAKGERHRRGRRDRNHEFRKPRTDAPAEGATAAAADGAPAVREPREDKRTAARALCRQGTETRAGNKAEDKGKFGGGRDKGGREQRRHATSVRDSGPSHRQYATSAPPRERERPVDPNSPFAKLAALKEQLTANRKDR